MANFDKEIETVLKHEGGYVHDPQDPGGETKYGISKKSHPEIDIKNLTLDQAKKIYKTKYWDKMRLDEIVCQKIAGKMFDMGVNSGIKRSTKIAQKACNILGCEVVEDGILGKMTIRAINSIKNHQLFLKIFICFRVHFYIDLTVKYTGLKKFLKGWIARA